MPQSLSSSVGSFRCSGPGAPAQPRRESHSALGFALGGVAGRASRLTLPVDTKGSLPERVPAPHGPCAGLPVVCARSAELVAFLSTG